MAGPSKSWRSSGPAATWSGPARSLSTGPRHPLHPALTTWRSRRLPGRRTLNAERRGLVLIGECTSDIGVHVHRNVISMCAPALPYVTGCLAVAARPPERRRRSGALGRGRERPPLRGCLYRHRGGSACARHATLRRGRSRSISPSQEGRSAPLRERRIISSPTHRQSLRRASPSRLRPDGSGSAHATRSGTARQMLFQRGHGPAGDPVEVARRCARPGKCARARLRPRGRSHVRVRAMACRSSADTRAVTVRRSATRTRRQDGRGASAPPANSAEARATGDRREGRSHPSPAPAGDP